MVDLDEQLKQRFRTPAGRRRFGIVITLVGVAAVFSGPLYFDLIQPLYLKIRGIDPAEHRRKKMIEFAARGGEYQYQVSLLQMSTTLNRVNYPGWIWSLFIVLTIT